MSSKITAQYKWLASLIMREGVQMSALENKTLTWMLHMTRQMLLLAPCCYYMWNLEQANCNRLACVAGNPFTSGNISEIKCIMRKKTPTFWSTMEHTRSLTADSDMSLASRFTVSLVSPICSRKDTPWKEPRELVGLGTLWLPLDSRM